MIESTAPIINIVLLLALLFVILRGQMNKPRSNQSSNQPTNSPPDKNSDDAIDDASKKAQEIVAQAEAHGLKIATETKLDVDHFKKEFDQKIDLSIKDAQEKYEAEISKTVAQYQSFLKQLEDRSVQSQQDYENMMKARINELLFSLEQDLTSFLNSSEQKSIESLGLELKSARQLIDTYRSQQLKLIDENIIAVLERTIALVLKNKIDLKDQLDLVYQALEKAKIENFFS